MTKLGWLCFAALLATSHAARADDEPERHLTVMVAPLRAIIPLGEITVEYAISQKLGASIELGAGQRSVTAGSDTATGTEIEGGAQIRYYALGSFRHGMELGGELLEEYVKFQEPLPGQYRRGRRGWRHARRVRRLQDRDAHRLHVRSPTGCALSDRRARDHGASDRRARVRQVGATAASQHRLVVLAW